MKKIFLPVASAALVLAAFSALAEAAPTPGGEVAFKGSFVASTCVIDIGDQKKSVALGQYATNIFSNIGDKTPDVPFTINLTNCAQTAKNYGLRFEGITVPGNPNLLALDKPLTAGAAAGAGAGIEILGAGDKLVSLNQPAEDTTWQAATVAGKTDSIIFNLKAHYKSFAQTVTAGDANSSIKFVIAYK